MTIRSRRGRYIEVNTLNVNSNEHVLWSGRQGCAFVIIKNSSLELIPVDLKQTGSVRDPRDIGEQPT